VKVEGHGGEGMGQAGRWAANFAHPVHRFSKGYKENSIDHDERQDYLHARLNREA
jgi:hypothetical protein